MKIAIMQPYIFPYVGYFNLLHACDLFISLDDVQHIRRGWVNRNRIQQGDTTVTFTVPLVRQPRDASINEQCRAADEFPRFRRRFEGQLQAAYAQAPYFRKVRSLVLDVLDSGENNMARLAELSLQAVLDYLEINRTIWIASQLPSETKGDGLTGDDRLIHIASQLGTRHYVNLPGGKTLYEPAPFAAAGLDLCFINPLLPQYERDGPWVKGLSIIDPLMHLSPAEMRTLLSRYTFQKQGGD